MKSLYLTPRLAIATLNNHADANELAKRAETRHGRYYTLFNLTYFKMDERCVEFKWRGLPFSLTETVKILTQIDVFLRINIANTAIICVGNPAMHPYALFVLKTYLQICQNALDCSSDTHLNKKIESALLKAGSSQPYLTE